MACSCTENDLCTFCWWFISVDYLDPTASVQNVQYIILTNVSVIVQMLFYVIFDDCQIETVYTCLAFCLFRITALSWFFFQCLQTIICVLRVEDRLLSETNWLKYRCPNCWVSPSVYVICHYYLQTEHSNCSPSGNMHLAMFFSPPHSVSVSRSLSLTSVQLQTWQCQWCGWMSSACCTCQTPLCSATVTSQSPRLVEHIDFHHTIKTSSLYWTKMCPGAWCHTSVVHTYTHTPQLPVTNIIHF